MSVIECPNPPANLNSRYRTISGKTTSISAADGGDANSVIRAFLSRTVGSRLEYFCDKVVRALHWGGISTFMRNERLSLNNRIHKHGCVMLTINLVSRADPTTPKEMTISKAFGRTLRRICSYNDNIVGGHIIVRKDRTFHEDAKADQKPNQTWTKKMLQQHIINKKRAGGRVWRNMSTSGTITDLQQRLLAAGQYETLPRRGHAIGFTVCHENEGVTKTPQPQIVLCNWGECHKGDASTPRFIAKLQQNPNAKSSKWRMESITLLLA